MLHWQKGGINMLKKAVSKKALCMEFIGSAIVLGVFAYLHLLTFWYIICILCTCFLAVPFNLYAAKRRNDEKKRFDELCLYMKHVIINYKISAKILVSLENTLHIFDEHSTMYTCIKQAIHAMKEGKEYEDSLAIISCAYPNFYVETIHEFMMLGEQEVGVGVNYSLSQINIKEWQQRVELLEENKYKIKSRSKYFALGSLFLSYYIMIQLDDYLYLLKHHTGYLMITLLYFIAVIIIYVISNMLLIGKWIEEE